eukprot:751900_1
MYSIVWEISHFIVDQQLHHIQFHLVTNAEIVSVKYLKMKYNIQKPFNLLDGIIVHLLLFLLPTQQNLHQNQHHCTPTPFPTANPTEPTNNPTIYPTTNPTVFPTITPTYNPSKTP